MVELKACPFCGGEARVCELGIICTTLICGALMRYPYLGASLSETIEAWNRRVIK